ncbi:unnamed protein product [Clonostachys rosea]|uniref:F-box domain-containing protein n=1 Tax=Bionectria ochroleuca TaxID=29856 RepID=A0ABY6UFC6_BIOOC|nr:unnamed protein product [Clonostachys rosea]
MVEDLHRGFADDDYKTLKSLRLVCSLFNQVATAFLMPILRVQLDKPSLDRIQAISRNPLLCSGLRGIQVRAGYRFQMNALHKEVYFTFQRHQVNRLLHYHAFYLGRRVEDVTTETHKACIWTEERFTMLEGIRACVLACDRCLGRDVAAVPRISLESQPQSDLHEILTRPVEEALIDEYQEILYKAYEAYKRQYERDWPVISEGLLISALSKVLSGPPRPVSLSFRDITRGMQHWFGFKDKEEATKWLAQTTGLSEVSELEGRPIGDELQVYSGLLWHLPIAISQTGSVLSGLRLHGPLVGYEYNMIGPKDISPAIPDQPVWDQLQVACQNLQEFVLTNVNFHYKLRHNRFPVNIHGYEQPVDEGLSIGKYIGTILSGTILEKVKLDASVPGLRGISRVGARCPLGYALSRMTCTNMRVVSLTNIGITQKKLETFCQSLNSSMQLLELSDVQLTHGSWVPILDLLRGLLNERWAERKCQVQLSALSGAEIEQLEAAHQDEDEHIFVGRLMGQFMEYIQSQQIGKNPAIVPEVVS